MLAKDIGTPAALENIINSPEGILYVMEFMEHGNFNVLWHQSPYFASTKSISYEERWFLY